MQDGKKRPLYEPVVEEYLNFFETTVIAHLIAMSTLLYSVLETRSGTHNIPGLIRAMRNDPTKNSTVLAEVEAAVAALRPIWIKISRVRNEVFAHRSRRNFPKQVFAEIQLHPDEISVLMDGLKNAIRSLAAIDGRIASSALGISATEDTERLMLALAHRD